MLPLFLFAAASADSAVIEEVVVTALKREMSLRDTPLAISAVSGATLVDRGIDNVSDLLRTTPGLAVLDQGAGQRRLIVRGNVFDEVAIGRVLSSPFGFDLTLSAPPRTLGMGFSMKW